MGGGGVAVGKAKTAARSAVMLAAVEVGNNDSNTGGHGGGGGEGGGGDGGGGEAVYPVIQTTVLSAVPAVWWRPARLSRSR